MKYVKLEQQLKKSLLSNNNDSNDNNNDNNKCNLNLKRFLFRGGNVRVNGRRRVL